MTGSPTSIAEVVALLNALPPPVTVACFVESLDRPLHALATTSPFSAQPAMDRASPRIFIRNGPLTMAVVPAGMGKRLLEVAEHDGAGRTLKGEVELPFAGTLAPSAPYDRVQAGEGTTCGTCHDDEAPASAGRSGFASEILRPPPELDVTLDQLRHEAAGCDASTDADRCALLGALFDHGEVRAGALPGGGRLCDH